MDGYYKGHETRATRVTGHGQEAGSTMDEMPVPRHASRVDRVILRDPSPIWGPFRTWMAADPVAVEFHSSSLGRYDLRRYMSASMWVANHLRLAEPARLMMVCWQRPRARLATFGDALRPGPCDGSWVADYGGVFQTLVIALKDLPVIPGTSALRLIPASTDPAEIQTRTQHLLTDPTIPVTIRKGLLEDFQMKNFPATETERRWTVDELLDRGRLEGERAGRLEGRLEGERATLVALLAELRPALSPTELQQLSIPELHAQVLAASRGVQRH